MDNRTYNESDMISFGLSCLLNENGKVSEKQYHSMELVVRRLLETYDVPSVDEVSQEFVESENFEVEEPEFDYTETTK